MPFLLPGDYPITVSQAGFRSVMRSGITLESRGHPIVDLAPSLGGFDGRQYRLSVQNFGAASGSFTFGSTAVGAKSGATAQTFGGDLATFMFGSPSSGRYDLAARTDYHQYYTGSFVQDDWRVSDRLTLNGQATG